MRDQALMIEGGCLPLGVGGRKHAFPFRCVLTVLHVDVCMRDQALVIEGGCLPLEVGERKCAFPFPCVLALLHVAVCLCEQALMIEGGACRWKWEGANVLFHFDVCSQYCMMTYACVIKLS